MEPAALSPLAVRRRNRGGCSAAASPNRVQDVGYGRTRLNVGQALQRSGAAGLNRDVRDPGRPGRSGHDDVVGRDWPRACLTQAADPGSPGPLRREPGQSWSRKNSGSSPRRVATWSAAADLPEPGMVALSEVAGVSPVFGTILLSNVQNLVQGYGREVQRDLLEVT